MPASRLRLRDIRNTSTFRLTMLLGLVTMVGVVSLLGLIYGLSARELNARSDYILRAEGARLSAMPPAILPASIRAAIARSTTGLNYYGLRGPAGQHLAGNLIGSSRLTPGQPREVSARAGVHGAIRILAVRTASGETILIGRDIAPIVDLRRRVTEVVMLSGMAIAILIVVAGIALSLAPLRRVDALQRSAAEIAAGHLDMRMPILGRGDELDLFAGTVNTMVEEVGRVVAQVKAVTDAVAHDLRTPLTRVRSQLYRVSREPNLERGIAERIDLAIDDLDRVLERFAALLRISELEASNRRAGFGPVALDKLVRSVFQLYEPLAEEAGIALSYEVLPDAAVQGDEKLLFEAIGNLVDNAIKFATSGGKVALSLTHDGRRTCIEVRDDGPGIPADRRQAVLRRFDRGDADPAVIGTGLGLSVVSAILHLHQFTLEFDDAHPGLIARIVDPGC